MLRKLFLLASIAGLLAGCALPTTSSAPTPYPADYLPTVIHLTARSIDATTIAQTAAAATPTLTPSLTPSPTVATPTASLTPTPLPGMQPGAIQIKSPGPMSKVVSPLEVRLNVDTQKNTKVSIALYGEDNALLADELFNVNATPNGEYIYLKLPFEIRATAENGYLQVTTRTANGVLMALNTVEILLLSSGVSQINPPGNMVYERVSLETPAYHASISGGILDIKGTYLPVNLRPTVIELVDLTGKSLNANTIVDITSLDTQIIDKQLPYKVDAPTQAYLVIHQPDEVLNDPVVLSPAYPVPWIGPAYVFSQLITLNP